MARIGLTTGQKLQEIFLAGDINPWGAYQQLKAWPGFRGSYNQVLRLFYAARVIGLIEFSREEESSTPIAKRFHRIVSGCEQDSRWFSPYVELYPAAGMGGLNYVRGTSQGRRREYETRVPTAR